MSEAALRADPAARSVLRDLYEVQGRALTAFDVSRVWQQMWESLSSSSSSSSSSSWSSLSSSSSSWSSSSSSSLSSWSSSS